MKSREDGTYKENQHLAFFACFVRGKIMGCDR
jgi:hypothetical protein